MTPEQFREWVRLIVAPLVTQPEKVAIVESSGSGPRRLRLEVSVDVVDRGRVLGRRGATIHGLRALVEAAGGCHGLRVTLELEDEAGRR